MRPIRHGLFVITAAVVFVMFSPRAKADAPGWMHSAATAPLPKYDEKTDAGLLYSEDVTTVTPDGKMKELCAGAYKILAPGRPAKYGEVYGYSGRDQKIGSMKAWCIPRSRQGLRSER